MRTAAGAFIVAIVLLLVGFASLNEARATRRHVAEEERLSTLHYQNADTDPASASVFDRVTLPFSSAASATNGRATMSYWQGRYETLAPLTGGGGERQTTDANLLLIAANAAYRSSASDSGGLKAVVDHLDTVIQSYGDVLRGDPNNEDAAYNYEFVSRLRDAVAKSKAPRREQKASTVPLSNDLPIGPTPHGRPGGPPPEVSVKEFKTLAPLSNDERGEEILIGRNPVQRRKG